MAVTCRCSSRILCSSTLWPRNWTVAAAKVHLAGLIVRPFFCRRVKNCWRCSRCYSKVRLAMMWSSRWVKTKGRWRKSLSQPLEGLRGVAEAERHEQVFKEAERRYNGCFRNVSRVHWNLVVPLDEVDNGGEPASV